VAIQQKTASDVPPNFYLQLKEDKQVAWLAISQEKIAVLLEVSHCLNVCADHQLIHLNIYTNKKNV